MKRLMIFLVLLLSFSISVQAQTAGDKPAEQKHTTMQHGKAGEGMMSMCQNMMGEGMMPMMQHMMGHGLMMRDMMQMMVDMMKMQKNMLKGTKTAEAKEMIADLDKMIERTEKMMSEMRSMHMKGMMGQHGGHGKPEQKAVDPKKDEGQKPDPHKHH